MTTPGGQNTWNLTRLPLENGGRAESRPDSSKEASNPRTNRTGVVVDMPEIPAPPPSTATADAAPQQEMVPEVSLNEYVSGFHYEPLSQPEQVPMRGKNPALGREFPAPADGFASPSAETVAAEAASVSPAEDVIERLGLEPMEDRSDRPRFLDINPPTPPLEKPATGASTIAGPSLLGLSDALQITSEDEAVAVQAPARANWPLWFAVAAVLVLAALGILQWRSQMRHANNGPVEVIGMKIRNLLHSESSNRSADATGSADSPRPETKVEQLPEPKTEDQSGAVNPNVSNSGGTDNQAPSPSANVGSPNVTAAPVNQPDTGQNAVKSSQPAAIAAAPPATGQGAAPTKLTSPVNPNGAAQPPTAIKPQAPAEKAKPRVNEEFAVKKSIPGQEEMAKANDASDSAAQAAWLWKATAKGNPEAPVTLANMFIKGNGVPRSCEQALMLLKTAATKQNGRARNRLGSLYTNGVCVQRNRVEAYRWFSSALAANPSSQVAQDNRDLLWQQMTPDERALAEKYR